MSIIKHQSDGKLEILPVELPHVYYVPSLVEGKVVWSEVSFEQRYGVAPAKRRCLANACNSRLIEDTMMVTIVDRYYVTIAEEVVTRYVERGDFEPDILKDSAGKCPMRVLIRFWLGWREREAVEGLHRRELATRPHATRS